MWNPLLSKSVFVSNTNTRLNVEHVSMLDDVTARTDREYKREVSNTRCICLRVWRIPFVTESLGICTGAFRCLTILTMGTKLWPNARD